MKGEFMDKLKNLGQHIKQNRKLQIGLAILLAAVLVLCYFLFIRTPTNSPQTEGGGASISASDAEAYAKGLEDKLEDILSQVKGAGNVNVLVTLGSGFEYVYATEETVKQNSSGSTTTTSIILVSGKPVLVKEIYPEIKGVLVSASGADNLSVKVNLVTAIQTVIDIANEDILILTGA